MKKFFLGFTLVLSILLSTSSLRAEYIPYQVSSGASKQRIERVRVTPLCSSSPCSINSQSGSWVTSITRASTGIYALNIAANIFGSAPTCVASQSQSSSYSMGFGACSTSTCNFSVAQAGTPQDAQFDIICMGTRP